MGLSRSADEEGTLTPFLQLADALPVVAIDALHVLAQRVRMHRHFRMIVRAHHLRAFDADRAIAERSTSGGTGDDADVVGHGVCVRVFAIPSEGVGWGERSEPERFRDLKYFCWASLRSAQPTHWRKYHNSSFGVEDSFSARLRIFSAWTRLQISRRLKHVWRANERSFQPNSSG
jgi:hypothetical protein